MNVRGIAMLLVLLTAAAGSWMLIRSTDNPAAGTEPGATDLPGYYLRGAQILGTAQDGSLLYRIEAENIRQQPTDNSVQLQGVRVQFTESDQENWIVTAREGHIEGSAEQINLRGNVELVSGDKPPQEQLQISTETLMFQPRERLASTPDVVQISQRGYVLNGIGLEADLQQQKLRLLSDVSGTFTP